MRVEDGPEDCTCPTLPELWWLRWDDVWIKIKDITDASDPATDSLAYSRSGCLAWRVTCPTCGMRYGGGS